ncbi:hypothetical protein [Streptomyces sp. NPDC001828]|uniref:hypothetical protein n=1 Tax=Streptomyces sp. NPDC001828 TaxID=3364615 RepID=UPI0036792B14
MSDDQTDGATIDETPAPTAKPVAKPVATQDGRQTLEYKTIQGQVITHTIIKPQRGE